ncbi:MAG: zinc finger protein [Candidatus Woesearchaeota archaeon]|nr:zinc finger protein [Candidatus Woesearchaeota archaeon]MDN5327786.1 zinc finger protein [Candidatus Woesearchaeota archaeon]
MYFHIMTDEDFSVQTFEGETCPICNQKTLTLMESEREIPYFGKVILFSMNCSNCHYHKSDVEIPERRDPVKYTFTVENEDDLKVRVIKSAEATVKIGKIATIEPGIASNGYISNIEGVLQRLKHQLEGILNTEDDPEVIKKTKAHLKKLRRVLWGSDPITITIIDPSGNSAIISDKAMMTKIKK